MVGQVWFDAPKQPPKRYQQDQLTFNAGTAAYQRDWVIMEATGFDDRNGLLFVGRGDVNFETSFAGGVRYRHPMGREEQRFVDQKQEATLGHAACAASCHA